MNKFNSISLFCLLALNSTIIANDGFDDEFDSADNIKIVKIKEDITKKYSLYGSLTSSTSYNYSSKKPINNNLNDFRGLSSAKATLNLNFDYKFNDNYKLKSTLNAYKDFIYDIKKDEYNTIAKNYDREFNINELYLQAKINNKIDFSMGRQIVVWGKSDNIRISDTINSLDNRMPGMVDIKDLRLARFISKLDYYVNTNWNVSAMLLHENRFSKMPEFGSDYASSDINMANSISIDEPNNSIKNSGFALAINGNLQAQDISFYLSNQYVDNTTYKTNMLGFAYNKVINSFLLKTEFAYFDNYDSSDIKEQTDALLGFDYTGIKDGSITFELANKNKQIQYALRFSQSYLNNTLDYTLLYTAFGKYLQDGGFIRTWIDYDINDKVSSSFGIINYLNGDLNKFKLIKNNDRVFANIKYSF